MKHSKRNELPEGFLQIGVKPKPKTIAVEMVKRSWKSWRRISVRTAFKKRLHLCRSTDGNTNTWVIQQSTKSTKGLHCSALP